MRKYYFVILLLLTVLSCRKNSNPSTISIPIQEELSAPGSRSDYWTLKLFAPPWLGRRSGMTCFVIGNYAYVYGGYDHEEHEMKNDLYRYDPVTNVYNQRAPMPFSNLARMYAVAFTLNNKGYIATGYSAGVLNDLWEYDPSVGMGGTWTQKASLPGAARWRAVGFAINNKGYVATGNPFGTPLKDIWEFDPINNSWAQKTNMPTIGGRDKAFAFVVGGKAYIGGGNTPAQLGTFWEFNPAIGANGSWTQKSAYPGAGKEEAAAFATSTSGYVGTGSLMNDGYNFYKDFWRYSPATNTWTKREDFPGYQRNSALGFSINGIGYMGLGYNEVYTSTNDLYRYHP